MRSTDGFAHKYGPWAIVTGASSGIGQHFARELAQRGLSLLLVARRESELEALAADLRQRHGVSALTAALDVGAPESVDAILARVGSEDVGLLVSNAGVGAKGLHHETPEEKLEAILAVNCGAPVRLARALTPRLVARGRGGLVFVGSMEAYGGAPYSAAYAASKNFVGAFAEGLWGELGPLGIDVLAVHPGPTDTAMLTSQGIHPDDMFGLMTPAEVAKRSVQRLARGPSYVPGLSNRLTLGFLGMLPRRQALRAMGMGMKRAIQKGQGRRG